LKRGKKGKKTVPHPVIGKEKYPKKGGGGIEKLRRPAYRGEDDRGEEKLLEKEFRRRGGRRQRAREDVAFFEKRR